MMPSQVFDLTKVVLDTNQIMKLIPHRQPALLVDNIIELSDNKIVGTKKLHLGDSYFQGHFPDEPLFPGVLQLEAMAQTAAVLCVMMQNTPSDYATYLVRMDESRFRRKVLPGETMVMLVEMIEKMPRDLFNLRGKLYVNNELASETALIAKITKK